MTEWQPRRHLGTTGLMAAATLVFAVVALDALRHGVDASTAILGADPRTLARWGAFNRAWPELWRAVMANLLHIGVAHLYFNMSALKVAGPPLDKVFGPPVTVAVFFVTGTAAMLAGASLSAGFGGGWLGSLLGGRGMVAGASAGVMGIIGFVAMFAHADHDHGIRDALLKWVGIIMVLGVVLTLTGWIRVDNLGHALGAIFGAALCRLFLVLDRFGKRAVMAATLLLCLAGLALIIFGVYGRVVGLEPV